MNGKDKQASKTMQKQTNMDLRLSKARKSTKMNYSNRNKSIKKRKPCEENCKKHQFQIRPLGYSSFLSKGITETTVVNFCCKGNSTTIPLPIISQQLKTQPHVPMFILKDQEYKYLHYLEPHREQFSDAIKKAEKLADSDQEKEEILIPVPKTKNCQICRMKIETQVEYQRHLSSIDHQIALRNSLGQKYIVEETQALQIQKQIQNKALQKLNQVKEICQVLKETKKILKSLLVKK